MFNEFAVIVYGTPEQVRHFEHIINKVGPWFFIPWFKRVKTTKNYTVFSSNKKIDRAEIGYLFDGKGFCELFKGTGLEFDESWFFKYYVIES